MYTMKLKMPGTGLVAVAGDREESKKKKEKSKQIDRSNSVAICIRAVYAEQGEDKVKWPVCRPCSGLVKLAGVRQGCHPISDRAHAFMHDMQCRHSLLLHACPPWTLASY